jgi:hypothetical protein
MGERIDLEALTAERRTVVIEFRGERASVTYDPDAYTLAFTNRLLDIVKDEDTRPMAELLSGLIIEWELVRHGEPIPTDADGIASLPYPLLNAVLDAIQNDAEPSRAEGNGSFAQPSTQPSDSTPPAESSPPGTDSSPSPAGSELNPGPSPVSGPGG